MGAKVLGNRGPYFRTGLAGVSIENKPDGTVGWVAIVGQGGDKAYLTAASVNSNNKLQRGYSFQSGPGGTVDFTLCPTAMILSQDETVLANALWGNTLSVPGGGAIVFAEFAFTGLRITLGGAGELYICSH